MNAGIPDPIHHLSQRIKYLPKELNATIDEIEKRQTALRQQRRGGSEKNALLVQIWVYEALKAMALVRHDKYERVLQGEAIVETILANESLIAQREICNYLQEALITKRDLSALYVMWEKHVAIAEKKASSGKNRNEKCVQENVILFHVYANCRQLQKLYQQATKIYKLSNDRQHLYWSVVSMAEYAKSLPEDSPQRKMVFTIASRMLDTCLKEMPKGQSAPSELVLYFSRAFIQNEKWDDARRLLLDADNIGQLEQFDAYLEGRATQLAKLLQNSGSTRESNALYQMLLAEYRTDEWQWWIDYLNTVEQKTADDEKEEEPHDISVTWTESETRTLPYTGHQPLQFIHAMQRKNDTLRGPYLAKLEYLWRKKGSVDPNFLDSYFARFGQKLVCFADILKYLPSRSDQNAVNTLLNKFKETAFGEVATSRNAVDQFNVEINYHKFHHVLLMEEMEQNVQTIRKLFARYTEAKKLNTGLSTDFQTTDPLLQLIVHKCLRSVAPDSHTPSDDLLFELAVLLEDGIKISPSNFQLRFLAIRVYVMLGAIQNAFAHYKRLDVKSVQFESVAYIIYYDLLRLGQWHSLKSLSHGTIQFEKEHEEHTGDMIFKSMSEGNFTSVTEFFRFGDMLDKTFSSKQAHTDILCFSLMDNLTPYTQRFSIFTNNGSYLHLKLLNQQQDWKNWVSFNEDLDMVDTLGSADNLLERFMIPPAVQNRERIDTAYRRSKAVIAIGAMTEMSFLVMEEVRMEKLRKTKEKEEMKKQKKQQKKTAGSAGRSKQQHNQKQQQQQQQSDTSKNESVKDELKFAAKATKLRAQLSECDLGSDAPTSIEWRITICAIKDVMPSIFDYCESEKADMTSILLSMTEWEKQINVFLGTIEFLSSDHHSATSNNKVNLNDLSHLSDLLFNHMLWWTCVAQTISFIMKNKKPVVPVTKPKGSANPIEQFKSHISKTLATIIAWLEKAKETANTMHFAEVRNKANRMIPDLDCNEDDVLDGVKHGLAGTIEHLRANTNNLILEVNALSSTW